MIKKLTIMTMVVLLLLSACSSSFPTTEPTPAEGEPYPAGGSPVQQPISTDIYPAPGDVPVDNSAYPYPAPGQTNAYDPQPADANLKRVEVTVDFEKSSILLLESFPVQVVGNILVQMPTPCHQARVVVSPPDAMKNIAVEVYSVVDPAAICVQVIAEEEVCGYHWESNPLALTRW